MSLAIAVDRLTAIVEQENVALTAMDFSTSIALLEMKRSAIATFELAGKVTGEPRRLDEIARLRAAVLANKILIERAITVQRRVIETVLAVAPKRDTAPRYSADAGVARAFRTAPMTLLARA